MIDDVGHGNMIYSVLLWFHNLPHGPAVYKVERISSDVVDEYCIKVNSSNSFHIAFSPEINLFSH